MQRRALAARCIQGFVRMCFSRKECQRRIQEARKQQEEQWRALQQALRTRWPELRQKRRVAIHVPSLSWDEAVRASTPNMPLQQCTQLARLCALADPLVDVLLVAPFPLPDDVLAYYVKLLEVGGVTEPRLRFKVVVPENADRFSPHFSLSSLALLSPRCLRRMRTFIRGREAYLVPGEVGHEDRRLALALGVPLLGPDPDIAQLFRSKSGSKRAFALADVNIPPGAHDLYEEEEVLIALSKLVAAHPHVERWLLKVDDETGGRGLAYLDTRHLPCVEALKKDRERTTCVPARRCCPCRCARCSLPSAAAALTACRVPCQIPRPSELGTPRGAGGRPRPGAVRPAPRHPLPPRHGLPLSLPLLPGVHGRACTARWRGGGRAARHSRLPVSQHLH